VNATAALVRKEARALAGVWLATVAGMLAGLLPLRQNDLRELGPLFYVFGTLALGASVVGHEYRYGTLAQMMAQPLARARVLAVKVSVLAVLLAAVAGVAEVAVFGRFRWRPVDHEGLIALFTLPLAYGLVVAPWLTIKTRSTLAGTLFSGALAAFLLIVGSWAGWVLFGTDREIDAFKMRVLWSGSAVLCVAAATAFWRGFTTLQVADGTRSDIALPGLGTAARDRVTRPTHPLLALAGKELRLQQLAFVATGIYVLVCIALWTRRSLPMFEDAIPVATTVYLVVLAALMGAFSSAEERVLGTLEWQLLQPVSARMQFAVKVAVTAGLGLLLAVGVPVVLSSLLGTPLRGAPRLSAGITLFAIVLSGCVYLSTVSSSAVAAFFAAIPALMASVWFFQNVVGALVFKIVMRLPRTEAYVYRFRRVDAVTSTFFTAALVLLVLEYALRNYRTADRSPRRIAIHVATVASLLLLVCASFAAAGWVLFF
jgi:ABC-type transport system involved in multi-copper enzyme maturation permease subunit